MSHTFPWPCRENILALILFSCFHNKGALCASYSLLCFYCRPILWWSLWSQVFCTFCMHFGAFFGCRAVLLQLSCMTLYAPRAISITWNVYLSTMKLFSLCFINKNWCDCFNQRYALIHSTFSPSLPPPFSPSLLPFQPMEKCSSESAQEGAYGSDLDSYSLYGRRRDLEILCRIETMAD